MFAARSLPSVCLSCRLRILAAQTCRPGLNPSSSRLRNAARRLSASSLTRSPQARAFSSTVQRCEATIEGSINRGQRNSNIPPSGLGADEVVRRARQTYGDSLPRGHLSDKEYTLYERLYGEPLFVDKSELEQVAEEEEVFEGVGADGTSVLLKKGEDGKLEEIEVQWEDPATEEPEEVELTEAEQEELTNEKANSYHEQIYQTSLAEHEDVDEFEDSEEEFMRSHPLTIAGRFATRPATIYLPKETFVDPVSALLTRPNHKHLAESSQSIFGGSGLPHSASTRPAHEGKEQKPIPLDPSQTDMGNIESDAYMAAVMPGTYATVMGTLVEVRRRLGKSWLEGLMKKKDGPLILDAGSGGAAVLAWHEVLRAEWLRMHEDSGATSHGAAPLGKATVLTGSDTLRHRASRLLENTQFIPRLPDTVSADEERSSAQPRKLYDIIIAPHTLWSLNQERLRKEQVQRLWSLLNPDGGVLILLEKGLPRGFEVIAAARELLLNKHISSPGSEEIETPLQEQVSRPDEDTRFTEKETGMIIAPCTNHKPCPMYQTPGISKGRKDFCYFNQRFIRPPYLQRMLNAKDRNHEDVQFSYLAVQRGRDQRKPEHDLIKKGVEQGQEATDAAFEGHEWKTEDELVTAEDVNPLSLPRVILPALKKRGHIILDVCTPAGTLERWTVPRSFSKQAFRDARKVRWGDLWGLGAKTRIAKNVRLGRPRDVYDKKGRLVKSSKKKETHVIEAVMKHDGTPVGEGVVARRAGGRGAGKDRRDRLTGRKGRRGKEVGILDE